MIPPGMPAAEAREQGCREPSRRLPVVDDEGFCRIPDQANIGITAGPAFGAIGILAALVRAQKTGEGANLEIAQSDAAA